MGLFDWVYVDNEIKLPGPPVEKREFQSKDFDCYMNKVRITAAGRLMYTTWHLIPAPEREDIKVRGEDDEAKDMNFHGILDFGNRDANFIAKFTDGQLVGITRTVEDGGAQ